MFIQQKYEKTLVKMTKNQKIRNINCFSQRRICLLESEEMFNQLKYKDQPEILISLM